VTRILLCHQPIDGGVGRHVEDLAAGLEERGYEIVLCAPSSLHRRADHGAYIHLDLQRAIAPRSDLEAVGRLARIVGDVRPDIVHAHSSKAGAVARLARLAHPRIPVVYTPHGYAFAGYFTRSSERVAYRCIERSLAPLASRVICVCEAEARLAASIGPSERVRVVYNGVSRAGDGQVDARIATLASKGPVIGALTLLRPGKGLETLIDAIPQVLACHPETQVAILGHGPDLDALRARTEQRGVAHAVHFPGSSTDPVGSLRGMDAFVHPSWAEAFPYVILEAMSLARPIVATNVGGVGEALCDGESGLLVAPRNAVALAEAIISVLDDPRRSAQMGAAALARVGQRFTTAAMIDRLASVYDELVCHSPGPVSAQVPQSEVSSPQPPGAMTSYVKR
jgi:glycosyltransferase involved in cell wall biosynthesis